MSWKEGMIKKRLQTKWKNEDRQRTPELWKATSAKQCNSGGKFRRLLYVHSRISLEIFFPLKLASQLAKMPLTTGELCSQHRHAHSDTARAVQKGASVAVLC